MACNNKCVEGTCKSSYSCTGPFQSKCSYAPIISELDRLLIPKGVYEFVKNRKQYEIIKYVQNNPKLFFYTYNFMQMLKFSYNLCGQNKIGCCYKMLWNTYGGQRIVQFNNMIDLYTYMIRYNNISYMAYYTHVVLKVFQNMNLARQMIAQSKSYPYQNLVRNRLGVNRKNCCAFNRLNYKNYRNINQNEYFLWFKQGKFFNPYD
jgi:hypothetical protein